MSTSDTPRTDAQQFIETNAANALVPARFARQLERELAEAKATIQRFRDGLQGSCYCCEPVGELNQQLKADLAAERAKVAKLREALDSADEELKRQRAIWGRELNNVFPLSCIATERERIAQALADTADRAPRSPDSPASVDAQT